MLPSWSVGSTVTAKTAGSATSIAFSAETLHPPSPVDLRVAVLPSGDLSIGWVRRSRKGFAWIDGIDAPLGEARELYRVALISGAGTIERETDAPAITITGTDVTALGAGPATIEVQQIGDYGASRPASLTIILA